MKMDSMVTKTLDDPTNNRRHPVPGPSGGKYDTEASDKVLRQAFAGRNATGTKNTSTQKLSIRKEHRIGTWNVQGLLHPGKLTIVEEEAKNHRISILGLSETHMRGQGHFTTLTGGTLYFSGCHDRSVNGVGILIPKELNKHVLGYNPVSDRIITMRIDARPSVLNIVQVYAPTSKANDEDIDAFYDSVETTLRSISNREITMILGDWNAKIGETRNDDHIRHIVGKFGLGARNDRGQRLIEFCIDKSLCITNSCFQHHPRRLYTWISPGARYRNQIDYILIGTRWRSSVTNVKTFPGAVCGSDHNLLVANFTLRLKTPQKRSRPKLRTLEADEKTTLREAVEAKLTSNPPPQDNSNACWEHFKTQITESLNIISTARKDGKGPERKSKIWISDNTWEVIQERKDVKAKGIENDETRKKYSQLCSTIKKQCRQDKNLFIDGICNEIESHAVKFQTADLFKKVRLLSSKFKAKSWVIEDVDGNLIHDMKTIAERWRQYCEHLYSNTLTSNPQPLNWHSMEMEPSILRSEITAAIARLKDKKAPGPDHITAEVIKALGEKGIDVLHTICNHIWQHGDWPKDWTESIILPLHKKGSTRKCDNYRTLALISHCSKILLHILNSRIRYYLDWQIPQEQAGFVKGKGTREQILNIRQLIEKAYEFNTPLILCFIDYSKAFDCVDWSSLWTVLAELGVPQHIAALLQSLYLNNQGVVRVNEGFSKPFKFMKGVRQGCVLSPILFNIYGEYIMRKTCENWEGGVTIGGTKITNLRYADDTTLFSASEAEMVTLLERMENTSTELGLSINRSKTKVMVIDRAGKMELTGALNLDIVDNFTYLGSTITNNGSCEPDVRRRIGMAKNAMSQLYKIWSDRSISIKTKRKLVTSLVFSIFQYGAETWTLKKADRMRIDAFEMWCWRKMLRIPWTAHRTNASILHELSIKSRLSTICLRGILEFFGHIARKEGDNLEKLVITGKVEGKRPRGRSPMRWSDQIRSALDTTVSEAIRSAEDRPRWRHIVRTKILQHKSHDPQQ